MKKIKVIPFIISILFPLVCTAFIVAYSYGAIGNYPTNQNKYNKKTLHSVFSSIYVLLIVQESLIHFQYLIVDN